MSSRKETPPAAPLTTPSAARLDDSQRSALAILIAVAIMGNIASIGGRMAMPLFAVSLSASPMTVGLILACNSIIPVFVAVMIGRWVDRVGPRVPMLISSSGVAAGLLLPAILPSLWTMAACAAVMGISMAMSFISIQHAAGNMGNAETRLRIFTALTIGQSLPVLISPPITGFLIDSLGYRAAFLGLAGFALLMVIMLVLTRSMLPDARHRQRHAGRNLLDLLRHPGVRAALIISSIGPLGWEMMFFFVPVHGSHIGLSASTIGLVFSCFSMSLIGIRVAVPWINARAGEWGVITVSFGIAAAMFLLFPFANSAAAMMVLAIVLGACHGVNVPIALGITHAASPPARQAEVLGMRSTVLNAVSVAAPLFLGTLTAGIGLGLAALPLAVILMGGAQFANRRRKMAATDGDRGRDTVA